MLEHGAQCDDNWEQNLAGEMHTGGSFHFREEHIQHWEPILRERVLMAMAGLAMTHQGALNPKEMLQIPSGETRSSKRTGELYLESLWINYQREGDNNPVHIHSGEVSMVIFLDVLNRYLIVLTVVNCPFTMAKTLPIGIGYHGQWIHMTDSCLCFLPIYVTVLHLFASRVVV